MTNTYQVFPWPTETAAHSHRPCLRRSVFELALFFAPVDLAGLLNATAGRFQTVLAGVLLLTRSRFALRLLEPFRVRGEPVEILL